MTKKVYFVRHGKSIANATAVVGTPDTPLAEEGLEQARVTGQDLKGMGVTTVVCSPFIRAQQTAEIIAGEIGVPIDHIQIIEELHERRMGDLEGKPKRHETPFFFRNDAEFGFETHSEIISRLQIALKKLAEVVANSEGNVVAVGHAAAGLFLVQVAEGKTKFEDFDENEQLGNAEFIELPVTQV